MHRKKHHIYAGKILHRTKLISSSKHKSKKILYKRLQFHFTKRYYEINELECKTYINFPDETCEKGHDTSARKISHQNGFAI